MTVLRYELLGRRQNGPLPNAENDRLTYTLLCVYASLRYESVVHTSVEAIHFGHAVQWVSNLTILTLIFHRNYSKIFGPFGLFSLPQWVLISYWELLLVH